MSADTPQHGQSRGDGPKNWLRRIGWFIALYAGSLVALGAVAWIIRSALRL